MGIFSSSDDKGEEMSKQLDTKTIKAYMGEDTVFNGKLSFQGTVRIDGRFEGEVHTDDTLIVGEKGEIVADIKAGTVICKGKIRGTIVASKRIEIHSTSEVLGNIKTPSLFIEAGSVFDGQCDMSKEDKKVITLLPQEEKDKEAGSSF